MLRSLRKRLNYYLWSFCTLQAEKHADDEGVGNTSVSSSKSRRKTLSLMVEPFQRYVAAVLLVACTDSHLGCIGHFVHARLLTRPQLTLLARSSLPSARILSPCALRLHPTFPRPLPLHRPQLRPRLQCTRPTQSGLWLRVRPQALRARRAKQSV